MTISELESKLAAFVNENPANYVDASYALKPEYVGTRFYDAPIIAVAAADDSLFTYLKEHKEAYGPTLRMPNEWLDGAVSVVSIFFPFSKEVRESNRPDITTPSDLWLHSRFEGEALIKNAANYLAELLKAKGGKTCVPSASPEFYTLRDVARLEKGQPPYVSNWSERHIAYVAGLGTFGLSKNLITKKGVCGRFISVITTLPLEVTPRNYTDPYEYCTFCGACAKRCNAGAIGPTEKHNPTCSNSTRNNFERFAPRYGCGKCQVSVPCETKIPKKI